MVRTTYGVRVNADSVVAVEAKQAARPAMVLCELHPAFEADYCPSCGTARRIG